MRRLLAHVRPLLVHAPTERRRPGETGFDQRHFEVREALEHAFGDQADDIAGNAGAEGVMLLHVIGAPAGAARRMAARGAGRMQAEHEIVACDGLVDRPIFAPAERLARSRRDDHLAERLVLRSAGVDLAHGEFRIFLRHHDAGLQAAILRHPIVDLPVVDRVRQRGAEFEIALLHAAARQAHHHAGVAAVEIEMLALHQFEIAAGRPAVGRIGVGAHAARHHARKRQLSAQALAEMAAKSFAVLAPARLEVRIKVLRRALHRMDVAIDKAQPLRGLGFALRHRLVHRAISSRIGILCSPASVTARKRG